MQKNIEVLIRSPVYSECDGIERFNLYKKLKRKFNFVRN